MEFNKQLSKRQALRLGNALDELDTGSVRSAVATLRTVLVEYFGVEDLRTPLVELGWSKWLVDNISSGLDRAFSNDEIKVISEAICAMIELRRVTKLDQRNDTW